MKYLLEIKNRIFLITNTVFLLITLMFYQKDSLLYMVTKPIIIHTKIGLYLICTNIIEGFTSYWYIIWIVLIHFIFYFILIQICVFFFPSLYKHEKKLIKLFLLFYLVITICLIIIFYKILLPFSWNFFYEVVFPVFKQQKTVKLFFEIKIHEYLNFFFTLYSICFILTNLFFFITIKLYYFYNNFLYSKYLKNYRKKLYFLFFIFSTLITPPDIISQIVVGFSFILLLEFIIILIVFIHKFFS